MSQPGMGYMINYLGGRSQEEVDKLKNSLGHKLKAISIDDDMLKLEFHDYPTLILFDDGQSCCESRYMVCDDTLSEFVDSTLVDIKLEDAPDEKDEILDVHEVQFLKLVTDRGIVTVSNHNEHNGYYGGFWLRWGFESEKLSKR